MLLTVIRYDLVIFQAFTRIDLFGLKRTDAENR